MNHEWMVRKGSDEWIIRCSWLNIKCRRLIVNVLGRLKKIKWWDGTGLTVHTGFYLNTGGSNRLLFLQNTGLNRAGQHPGNRYYR
ncbi:hypothetical protein HanXRQr2_Chr14g0653611 [Helianthus annuus]|uniref:Uncharacterized protein n=1 Tax=Helianthus annuus TaxID=4232 RepID=A0A9K3EB66_HELAN|nr:hypothetical protein HanXRQr2_Chr14g0653611 [Helianthus annuus]